MIVIGLGAGGCGLASLAHLLAAQEDSLVTKEIGIRTTGWRGSLFFELAQAEDWQQQLEVLGAKLAGDVGYYHLPYVYEIAKRHENCRIVWLGREKDKMIECLLKGAAATHPWLEHLGDEWQWNPNNVTFPGLGVPNVKQAAAFYVDFYSRAATLISDCLGERMRYFATRYLDSERGQTEILKFLEVENPVTFSGGINVNPS